MFDTVVYICYIINRTGPVFMGSRCQKSTPEVWRQSAGPVFSKKGGTYYGID